LSVFVHAQRTSNMVALCDNDVTDVIGELHFMSIILMFRDRS